MESTGLKRLLAVGLVLALGACGSEPEEDREPRPGNWDLRIPGMEGTARASFDAHGVLHVRCLTDADCMRVLGYFHASHRFFQMDLQRRSARGTLATLVAAYPISADVYNRLMFSTPEGEPLEEAIWGILGPEERELVEAYAQGVNAWLAEVRAGRVELPPEYPPLGTPSAELIPDWEPQDTLACARLMTYLLSASEAEEMEWGAAFSRLAAASVDAAVDLFTLRPAARVYTLPQAGPRAMRVARPDFDRAAVADLAGRLARVRSLLEKALAARQGTNLLSGYREAFGSNNWVVGPSRTKNGTALLANDPHLQLTNPPVFYLAHLDAKSEGRGTLHVAGATFPGIPAVVIGRNERVAWGATVAYYDVTDVYVEELSEDGRAVIFEGEEVPLVRRELGFRQGTGEPQLQVLEWVPHHGPIIQKDEANRTAISVRWTGQEPTNELRAFLGLHRAGSVEEAREALRSFEVGAQNWVLADADGSIGWFPHARVPSRPWASYLPYEAGISLPPWMPLPGDGRAEWQGFLPEEELPSAFDPEQGYLATANQDLTGQTENGDPTDTGRPMLQNLCAPGLRMARIADRLEASTEHSVESNLELQLDTHSLLGEWVVPFVLKAAEGATLSPEAEQLAGILREWQFTCPTGLAGPRPDSPAADDAEIRREAGGCAAFHFFLQRLMRAAFANRLLIAGISNWNANQLVRPLVLALLRPEELAQTEEEFWSDLRLDVRSRDQVLLEALEAAAAEIGRTWGTDPERWLWGKFHTVTFEIQPGRGILAPHLTVGPYAAPGGLFTVNVANPPVQVGRGFGFAHGASLRIVNELGAGRVTTWVQLPGGRDMDPESPFYAHLIENWLEGEPIRLLFERAEVDEAAVVSLLVGY